MHGRLKVKTTAEQEETRRKEKEKKLKLYLAGTAKTFEKRTNGELDGELLKVTGELLSANPDFYSLWNVRREVLCHLKQNNPSDDVQSHFQAELVFLEQCLRINPKSYGTWHHRSWVLENMPQADWARELQLCDKFLEYDERNFHCWDYRRFIVQKSSVPAKQELSFTTSKIESNFSNYSSWHYRSKLLPLVHGDPSHPIGVKEEQLLQESVLAQNAFFTDPNDQSAWFYHRWLLGRAPAPMRFECVHVSKLHNRIVVGLSTTVQLLADIKLTVSFNDRNIDAGWSSANNEKFSSVWECSGLTELSCFDGELVVSMAPSGTQPVHVKLALSPDKDVVIWKHAYKTGTRFCHELSAVTSDVLTQELDALQQLHDLEPDNKWVLLTVVSLMRALDPLRYEGQSNSYIDKLINVDPMRTNYYMDMKSKFSIENAVEQDPGLNGMIDLSSRNISSFVHAEHFTTLEVIDLSNNLLVNLMGSHCLQCLKVLKMNGNKIRSCEDFKHLSQLQELYLSENNISSLDDIRPLEKCTQLKKVDLKGNPVSVKITDGKLSFLPGVLLLIC